MLLRKIENSLYYENYIYGPALKYIKMNGPILSNYLKTSLSKIHKTKFKFYVHISNQNINLKLIYIEIDSKRYI